MLRAYVPHRLTMATLNRAIPGCWKLAADAGSAGVGRYGLNRNRSPENHHGGEAPGLPALWAVQESNAPAN
jgi:hypothetical protein